MDWKYVCFCCPVVILLALAMTPSQGVDLTLKAVTSSSSSSGCANVSSFHCESAGGECVSGSLVCDGVADCPNGRDEGVEMCGCLPTEFQCNTSTCIDGMLRCDTHSDCVDGKDELDCETYQCPVPTHIKCDNHFCIPRDRHCDFFDDCGDYSDEVNCPRRDCVHTEFHCNNSQCVQRAVLCDGIYDCADRSDEDLTQCEKHFKCPEGFYVLAEHVCDGWLDCPLTYGDEINCGECDPDLEFRCPNGQCIGAGNVCDGLCDCLSCEDEDSCDLQGCVKEEKYLCRKDLHSARCIDKSRVCDLVNDCKNTNSGYDEFFCWKKDDNCTSFPIDFRWGVFPCSEGRCIPSSVRCDYMADCLDGEDELDCDFPECKEGEFRCNNQQCISRSKRCDSHYDCHDWSDERNCDQNSCGPGRRQCDSGHCVEDQVWCDYFRDCQDGSDETNCEYRACTEGEFRCQNGQCIDTDHRCYYDRDRVKDGCADNSHLINCTEHVCRSTDFKCRNSYCVHNNRTCDGQMDCNKGTTYDEEDCPYFCPYFAEICRCAAGEMNCESLGLQEVPHQTDTEHISKLRLRGNNIILTNQTFSEKNYDKVTYLDLSNNSLSDIPSNCFTIMWQLTYLSLSDNKLLFLRNTSFTRLTKLKQLHLTGNAIERIEDNTFVGLMYLSSLDLSNQHLTTLRKNTFTGLKKLLTLDLSGNRIQHIDKGAFSGLLNIISINLSNNRIQHICDTVFQGLLHLHTLDISQNSIDDIGESVFLGLPSLETLETDSYKFCCLAHSAVHCLPEADEFSSCEDLMSSQVLRISIWVLGVVALCGNFVVIFWRVRDFRGGRVHSFLITNLAIGDLLMGVYLLIIAAVDTHYRGVYILHDQHWRQSALCQFAGFVSTFSSELSVLTLTTITVDRLLCILFPLKRTRLSVRQAFVVMALIWSLVFLVALLPLVGLDYFDGFYGRSGVCLALHVTPDRPPGWQYSVAVFLVLNLASFLLIAASYLWMFSVAKKTRSAVRTTESQNDNAMARRMTVIVMTDFCCWVPIILLGFASLAGARADNQVYAWIAVFVLPLNSATNPVLYTLSTAPFLGNVRKRASRFRKSFIHSFTADTKHSYVDDRTSNSYCDRKSPYRQLELIRLRGVNSSPPPYYNRDHLHHNHNHNHHTDS